MSQNKVNENKEGIKMEENKMKEKKEFILFRAVKKVGAWIMEFPEDHPVITTVLTGTATAAGMGAGMIVGMKAADKVMNDGPKKISKPRSDYKHYQIDQANPDQKLLGAPTPETDAFVSAIEAADPTFTVEEVTTF